MTSRGRECPQSQWFLKCQWFLLPWKPTKCQTEDQCNRFLGWGRGPGWNHSDKGSHGSFPQQRTHTASIIYVPTPPSRPNAWSLVHPMSPDFFFYTQTFIKSSIHSFINSPICARPHAWTEGFHSKDTMCCLRFILIPGPAEGRFFPVLIQNFGLSLISWDSGDTPAQVSQEAASPLGFKDWIPEVLERGLSILQPLG